MATISSSTYPSSFQLRLVRRDRGSSSVFFEVRPRSSIRRIRLICAIGGEGQSPDSFAGWSGSGDEVGGDDPKKKKKKKWSDRFGGMLGAGLAGVFFTAGVTFAALSLSKRATSGVKQQMEPLTTAEEVILTSDDRIAEVDQERNEANVVLQDQQSKLDNYNPDSQTGIDKDLLPHTENNEDSTGNSLDNIHHSPSEISLENDKSFSNGDSIPNISSQDDFQIGSVDDISIPSSPRPGSSEFSTNVNVDLAVASSSLKDSQSTVFSGSLDQTVVHDAKQSPVDSTTQISDEEGSTNLDVPLDSIGEIEGQPQSIPLISNLIVLESGDIVDSQDSISEAASTETTAKEDIIEQSDILQLPTGVSTLSPEVHEIVESVTSSISGSDLDQNETMIYPKESMISTKACILEENAHVPYSEVVLPDTNGNTPNASSHSQLGRISTFESTLPEKPISYAGIPAPSLVSAALQVPPGKVLVPAIVDQVQGQALAALQVLKVIEADVQPGDLCTRREYARWLVCASSALSRNTISKVYPAMYIENVTELAFDDVTPEDPDYSCIQGLAEAGIISSKLSESDLNGTSSGHQKSFFFSPESPVSRQDLVSWKMALERRQLPEVDKNHLYQCSGYIDIDKINKDAWPALVADLSAGEQGITALAFGYTRLFQPDKPVTKAQAAIALATGDAAEVVGEELTRIEAESLAETAVNAHTALVAQVEKELNASFEKELAKEREKINAIEKLAEEARVELERLKMERAEENNSLIRGRAAVESEMEVLSKLRQEVEEQLQDLISNKMEISFERDRINKLRSEAESDNKVIVQLQYELEVERKALSLARTWAEEEAKRAREQARALEEARDRWEKHGIKVVVDDELREDASTGITWLTAGKQTPVDESMINRAESLVEKLKAMAGKLKIKSSAALERIIEKIVSFISSLKSHASRVSQSAIEVKDSMLSKASGSIEELKEHASAVSSSVSDRAKRAAEDAKEGVEKFTQRFKT